MGPGLKRLDEVLKRVRAACLAALLSAVDAARAPAGKMNGMVVGEGSRATGLVRGVTGSRERERWMMDV